MAEKGEAPENVLEQFLQPARLERMEQVLDGRTSSLTIVLDRVQNSHNVSAVLRSADAFGVSEVHLVGSSFSYSPSISQGTERWMLLRQHQSSAEAISLLRGAGYRLAALRPEEQPAAEKKTAIPVTQLPFDQKLALVFGSEGFGLDDELSAAADIHAYIPMSGFVESLNISVACAICLFCSTISTALPERRTPMLSSSERESLKQQWLRTGVRNSDIILKAIEARQIDAKD
jgi:tRNA (guanosine-2'-O-)-methyltransferase